jgi:hypothetical protein
MTDLQYLFGHLALGHDFRQYFIWGEAEIFTLMLPDSSQNPLWKLADIVIFILFPNTLSIFLIATSNVLFPLKIFL